MSEFSGIFFSSLEDENIPKNQITLPMMDMRSRNQYLKILRERYLKTKSKKEKGRILDEYCQNTQQNRKYIIKKMRFKVKLKEGQRKKRKEYYDGYVRTALAKVWEIFDFAVVRD